MNIHVDLSKLAIRRDGPATTSVAARRHVLTRYVLPAALMLGFVALIGWAAHDFIFPATPVRVIPVVATRAQMQREGTPLFRAAGWVQPRPTAVRVAALAPGVVEQLLVVEDQPVKAGEPVARLVDDDARLALDRTLADLKLREAELQEVRATLQSAKVRFHQPVHLEAPLGDAEAKLAKIETDLTNLPFELRRAEARRKLAKQDHEGKTNASGVVSGIAVDQAKSELDSAVALVEELRQRADSLKKERAAFIRRRDALAKHLELKADETQAKDEAEAQVEAASARVEQTRVDVAEARLRAERMTVRAPVDGRVLHLVANPGTQLTVGMNTGTHDGSTVVTLYRPDMLQVRVDVRFVDLPQVSQGQSVMIESAAISSPLEGEVLFISSLADIQKNMLEVKVAIHEPPAVFKPDMLVDVTFLATAEPDSESTPTEQLRLYIPNQLIHTGEEGTRVWVADLAAAVARRVPVETGRVGSSGLVEITGGLTAASRLITSGRETLKDGARIRVTGEDTSLGRSTTPLAPKGSDASATNP